MGKEYRKNLLEKHRERISYLPPREQKILSMRYGIGQEEKPLKEIAAVFGVSEQTIRKYEAAGIRKIERLSEPEHQKLEEEFVHGFASILVQQVMQEKKDGPGDR